MCATSLVLSQANDAPLYRDPSKPIEARIRDLIGRPVARGEGAAAQSPEQGPAAARHQGLGRLEPDAARRVVEGADDAVPDADRDGRDVGSGARAPGRPTRCRTRRGRSTMPARTGLVRRTASSTARRSSTSAETRAGDGSRKCSARIRTLPAAWRVAYVRGLQGDGRRAPEGRRDRQALRGQQRRSRAPAPLGDGRRAQPVRLLVPALEGRLRRRQGAVGDVVLQRHQRRAVGGEPLAAHRRAAPAVGLRRLRHRRPRRRAAAHLGAAERARAPVLRRSGRVGGGGDQGGQRQRRSGVRGQHPQGRAARPADRRRRRPGALERPPRRLPAGRLRSLDALRRDPDERGAGTPTTSRWRCRWRRSR